MRVAVNSAYNLAIFIITPPQISEILEMLEKLHLLSPLLVVNTLSSSSTSTMGLVRDYLLRVVQADDAALEEDMGLIEQYRADTKKVSLYRDVCLDQLVT